MFEIEVTKPLPRLSLNEGQTGLAIVIRRKGRPVGFWLDAPAGKRILQPAELGQRIIAEAGQALLAEAIREEVAPSPAAALPSVTIVRPSGLKSAKKTTPLCPRRIAVCRPLALSHSLPVPS